MLKNIGHSIAPQRTEYLFIRLDLISMLIARYLCSNRDTTRFDGGEEKRGKRIRIERDRSIEVHAMVPVTRIPRRGTSSMVSATSNREGWFTSVFPRRLDLPLAKPTTAESKPIRADHAWTDQSSSLFLSFVTFLLPRVAPSSGPTLSQDISVILFFSFFLLLHPSTSPIFLYISSVRWTRVRENRERNGEEEAERWRKIASAMHSEGGGLSLYLPNARRLLHLRSREETSAGPCFVPDTSAKWLLRRRVGDRKLSLPHSRALPPRRDSQEENTARREEEEECRGNERERESEGKEKGGETTVV